MNKRQKKKLKKKVEDNNLPNNNPENNILTITGTIEDEIKEETFEQVNISDENSKDEVVMEVKPENEEINDIKSLEEVKDESNTVLDKNNNIEVSNIITNGDFDKENIPNQIDLQITYDVNKSEFTNLPEEFNNKLMDIYLLSNSKYFKLKSIDYTTDSGRLISAVNNHMFNLNDHIFNIQFDIGVIKETNRKINESIDIIKKTTLSNSDIESRFINKIIENLSNIEDKLLNVTEILENPMENINLSLESVEDELISKLKESIAELKDSNNTLLKSPSHDGDCSADISNNKQQYNDRNSEKIKDTPKNDLISEMKDAKEILDALNSHRLSNEIDKLIMYLMDQNYNISKKYTKISNDYSNLLSDFRNYKKVSRSTASFINELENSEFDKKSLIESIKAFAISKEKEVDEKNRQIKSQYEIIGEINENNPSIDGKSIHEIVRMNEVKDKTIDYLTSSNNDLTDKNKMLNDKYINLLEKYNKVLVNYKYRDYQVNIVKEWTNQIKEDLITGHLTSLSLLSQINKNLTNIVDNYEIYSNNFEYNIDNDTDMQIIRDNVREISEFIFEYTKNKELQSKLRPINPHKDELKDKSEVEIIKVSKNSNSEDLGGFRIVDNNGEKHIEIENDNVEIYEDDSNSIDSDELNEREDDILDKSDLEESASNIEYIPRNISAGKNTIDKELDELHDFMEDLVEFKDIENQEQHLKEDSQYKALENDLEDNEIDLDSLELEDTRINLEEILEKPEESEDKGVTKGEIDPHINNENSILNEEDCKSDDGELIVGETIDKKEYREVSREEMEEMIYNAFDAKSEETESELKVEENKKESEEIEESIDKSDLKKMLSETLDINAGENNQKEKEIDSNAINEDIKELENFVLSKPSNKEAISKMLGEEINKKPTEFTSNLGKYETKKGDNSIDIEVSNIDDNEIPELDINDLLLDETDVNTSKNSAFRYENPEKLLESKSIIGENAKRSDKKAINNLIVDDIQTKDGDHEKNIIETDGILLEDGKLENEIIEKESLTSENTDKEIKAEEKPIEVKEESSNIEENHEEIELTSEEVEKINENAEERMKPNDYDIDITTIKVEDSQITDDRFDDGLDIVEIEENKDINSNKEISSEKSDEITEDSVDDILENFSLDDVDISDIDI